MRPLRLAPPGLVAWALAALLALRCCPGLGSLEVSKDVVWMSQGKLPDIHAFFWDISQWPHGFVVWGAWGGCVGGWRTDKIRLLCFERVMEDAPNTCWADRNRMYAEVLAWERERGRRFLYIINCDEGATSMTLKPTCSPAGCGDFHILPREGENAARFWVRALTMEQPAVAAALVRNTDCGTMWACTGHFDFKLTAYHWSVQHIFWPLHDEWARVSGWAVDAVPRELWTALFQGYTANYLMFDTGRRSVHTELRGNYMRTEQPFLPIPQRDGTYADSEVVAWLRSRLAPCASARLGPSFLLRRRCPLETCRMPGLAKAGAEDEVDLSIDYSKIVKCRPWARRWQQNRTRRCQAAPRDRTPPAPDGVRVVQKVYALRGKGRAFIREVEQEAPNDPLSPLCATGRKSFAALAESAATIHLDGARAREVEVMLESIRHRAPEDLHPDCLEVCKPLILGALIVSGGAAPAHVRDLQCIAAMVFAWSWMDMLAAGWLGPFEMMLKLTGRGLPDGAPPVLEQGAGTSNHSGWLQRAADTPLAAYREVSVLAGDGWRCFLERAIPRLFEALRTATWRQGEVLAAQMHVSSCWEPTLFHPLASYMWGMLVLIGRAGVDATPPQPLPCGPEA